MNTWNNNKTKSLFYKYYFFTSYKYHHSKIFFSINFNFLAVVGYFKLGVDHVNIQDISIDNC